MPSFFFILKNYKDEVWWVVLMDICHLFLGRPCLYDMMVLYDGFKNIYSFVINGKKIIFTPLKIVLDPKTSKEEWSFDYSGWMSTKVKRMQDWVCNG